MQPCTLLRLLHSFFLYVVFCLLQPLQLDHLLVTGPLLTAAVTAAAAAAGTVRYYVLEEADVIFIQVQAAASGLAYL